MGTVAIAIMVALLMAAVLVAAAVFVRRFERYRLTEGWRNSDLRAAALAVLVFFGGLFGYRLPPPPRPGIESRHDSGAGPPV